MLLEFKELAHIHILEVLALISHWIQDKELWEWLAKYKQERRQVLFFK
jgi:hypothetical protein